MSFRGQASSCVDLEVKQRIEAELLNDDRVSSNNIDVDVTDGFVTLKGRIASFRRKLAAHEIVAAYKGICGVRNDLTVEPDYSSPDEAIAANLRNEFESSSEITKPTITLSVNGGKVTLSGSVASHWERVVADDIARGVFGVRSVVNMLSVDVWQKIDDCELMSAVKAALGRAPGLKNTDLAVAIGEDSIVLSGTVSDPGQKEEAQAVVRRFGLLHIRNEITVVD